MWADWVWHLFTPLFCPDFFFFSKEELCTEGDNLAYTFHHRERQDEEDIAFSQYPRPADAPQVTGIRVQSSFTSG